MDLVDYLVGKVYEYISKKGTHMPQVPAPVRILNIGTLRAGNYFYYGRKGTISKWQRNKEIREKISIFAKTVNTNLNSLNTCSKLYQTT